MNTSQEHLLDNSKVAKRARHAWYYMTLVTRLCRCHPGSFFFLLQECRCRRRHPHVGSSWHRRYRCCYHLAHSRRIATLPRPSSSSSFSGPFRDLHRFAFFVRSEDVVMDGILHFERLAIAALRSFMTRSLSMSPHPRPSVTFPARVGRLV